MDIKDVKKKLNITNKDISEMFGYKSANSYVNSSKKPIIESAITELYKRTINKIKECL